MVNCEDDIFPLEQWELSLLTRPPQELLHSRTSSSKLLSLSYVTDPTCSVYFAAFSFFTESLNIAIPKGSVLCSLIFSFFIFSLGDITYTTNVTYKYSSKFKISIVKFKRIFLFCFYMTCKRKIKQVITLSSLEFFFFFQFLCYLQILFSNVSRPPPPPKQILEYLGLSLQTDSCLHPYSLFKGSHHTVKF